MKVLNVRPKSIKFLEENIVGKLLDIDLGNYFSNLTPKANINKWDYVKLKCSAKDTINKMKRQPTE